MGERSFRAWYQWEKRSSSVNVSGRNHLAEFDISGQIDLTKQSIPQTEEKKETPRGAQYCAGEDHAGKSQAVRISDF